MRLHLRCRTTSAAEALQQTVARLRDYVQIPDVPVAIEAIPAIDRTLGFVAWKAELFELQRSATRK